MRLIDVDAAIESLTEYGNGRAVYIGVEEAVRRIEQLPPAQPDVIRCKDCVNYIDHRCVVADHHVAPFSCCQTVFNARRRGEQDG